MYTSNALKLYNYIKTNLIVKKIRITKNLDTGSGQTMLEQIL